MNKGNTGFTVIELMVVVVILAILAAIAYPAYMQYVERSRRNMAQAGLVELANFMERFYSNHGQYTDSEGNKPTLPFSVSPRGATGSDVYYAISVDTSDDGQSYELKAVPQNAQSDDACGTLTLTETGARGAAQPDCW